MTQDSGQRERQVPVLDSDVGVANAGSGDLHDDFVGCGRLKVDIPKDERCAHLLNHRG
jgi:hypothetical protein